MHTVLDAIQAFWDYLASVQPLPLAIAIGCHIVKTMCTSRAWRNVLVAAYPEERVFRQVQRSLCRYGEVTLAIEAKRTLLGGRKRATFTCAAR